MTKKKTNSDAGHLSDTLMEYPEAPKTIKEIASARRLALVRANFILELLEIQEPWNRYPGQFLA